VPLKYGNISGKILKENNFYDKRENINKQNYDSSSEDNSEDKTIINRKKYIITFKKNAVMKYKEIKSKFPKNV